MIYNYLVLYLNDQAPSTYFTIFVTITAERAAMPPVPAATQPIASS